LSLVNLPLLASLEKRFIHGELNYFLGTKSKELDILEGNNLVDKATSNVFALFWELIVLPGKKALSCFQV